MAQAPEFPFSRTTGAEPPLEYARLRREAPISRVKLFDASEPWLITQHADICAVLSDSRFSKIRTKAGFPELSAGGKAAGISCAHAPTFVDMDNPDHAVQ
eukprot:13900-Heterococcus_DN1.PRE.1